jgi:hypothetical protein
MKQLNAFLLFILTAWGTVSAQSTPPTATAYHFKHLTNVPLQDMSGATVLTGPTRIDDQASDVTSITFPFEFVGKTFTAFQTFSSGALVLHPSVSVTSTAGFQIVLPWADAIGTGDNGYIKYKVVGVTNRKLVVEYFMGKYVGNTAFSMLADKRFQVWFFENTNEIQFVYGAGTVEGQGAQAVVGLSGNDNSNDLLQVNTATHEVTVDPYYVSTTWPGEGNSYTFSPTEFVSVNPAVSINSSMATTICSGTSVLLSSSTEGSVTGFQWFKDGQPIAGATASQYAASSTGNYYVQVSFTSSTIESNMINVFVTALQATVSSTNVSCNAYNNGSISIANATGGNGVYEYSIGNNVWQQANVFSSVTAGTYNVQMRADGCTKSLGSVVITDAGTSPVVTIASAANACGNVVLTANPADAAKYVWSNGETTNSITLGNGSAEGNYTVTASNGNGCSGSASYTFNKQNQLNSYAIVSLKGMLVGENNKVNGGVANFGTQLPVYLGENATVNGVVRSIKISMAQQVTATNLVYAAPTFNLPATYSNTSVTTSLQNGNIADDFVGTLTGNYNTLFIGKRARVILSGKVFGKVTVGEGAEVSFTANDININNLVTDNGRVTVNRTAITTVAFPAAAIVRIKNKVFVGEYNRINAAGATFYFNDYDTNEERFTVEGTNTIVSCNVVMMEGAISVKGVDANSSCTMNGRFVAEYVGSERNVTWNVAVCNNIAGRTSKPASTVSLAKQMTASIYPNPGVGAFNIVVKSAKATSAEVIVLNENGVQVKKQMFMNVQSSQTLPVNLTSQPAGVYLVKVFTTEGVQTLKVVNKK